MADKKVQITFNVNAGDATQKLTQISTGLENVTQKTQKTGGAFGNTNITLLSFNRIIQDAPFGIMGVSNNITFLAEQMTYAKQQGVGFVAQIKNMGTAMLGTGGLMFAISAVTSLITYFSMQSRGAAESTKSLSEELKDMWSEAFKADVQFEKLAKDLEKFTVAELNESLRSVKSQIDDVGLSFWQAGLYGLGFRGVLEDVYKELDKLVKERNALEDKLNPKENRPKGIIELLQAEKDKYETLKKQATTLSDITKYKNIIFAIDDRLSEIDGSRTKELKDHTKELKEQKVIWEDFARLRNREMGRIGLPLPTTMNPRGGFAGNKTGAATQDVMAGMALPLQDIKQNFAVFKSIAESTAQSMRQAFSQAWQDIFGEANSLLEIFLQNIASGLSSLAAESVAPTIFSFLTGGLGGALGAFKPSGGDNIINLKIGDETVERFVYKGLPGAMNYATRIRAF